jgi:transcriptional regulator with XRE-family HTH domain
MVYTSFPEGHGAHDDSTRHTITPELAAVLADARLRRGWSLREAARNVGVAAGTIAHLEHARRAPSVVVARNIARAYQLSPSEADMLFAQAIENAGKDSVYANARQPRRRGSLWTGA